jgi:hypothetical protein
MKKLQTLINHHLPIDADNIKNTLMKILATLITLIAAATPWVLLIVRLSISGLE